jgi:hypothetical protein
MATLHARFKRRGVRWAIACLFLLGLFFAGYRIYDSHWISRAERKQAIRAIYSIDSMNDALEMPKGAYLVREDEAEKRLSDTDIAADTHKDRMVAASVEAYFDIVQDQRRSLDIDQSVAETERSFPQSAALSVLQTKEDEASEKSRQSYSDARNGIRSHLMSELE